MSTPLIPVQYPGSDKLIKKGDLVKLGGNALSQWKTRFFLLGVHEFRYYNSETDFHKGKPALGHLVVDTNLHCWSEKPEDLEFRFISKDKTVIVRATIQEKKEWYDAVKHVVSQLTLSDNTMNVGRPLSPARDQEGLNTSLFQTSPEYEWDEPNGEETQEEDIFTSARESNVTLPPTIQPSNSTDSLLSNTTVTDTNELMSPQAASDSTSVMTNTSTSSTSTTTATPLTSSLEIPSISHINTAEGEFILSSDFAASTSASQQIRSLFSVPATDIFLMSDISCNFEHLDINIPGRLWLTEKYIYFYSPFLCDGIRLAIPLKLIISVIPATQASILPTALKIFAKSTKINYHEASDDDDLSKLSLTNQICETSMFLFTHFSLKARTKLIKVLEELSSGKFDKVTYLKALAYEIQSAREQQATSTNASSQADENETNTTSNVDTRTLDDQELESEEFELLQAAELADHQGAQDEESKPSLDRLVTHLDFGGLRSQDSLTAGGNNNVEAPIEMRLHVETTFPTISPKLFQRIFFSDQALFSAEQYHKLRGDSEFQVSSWKSATLVEGPGAVGEVRDLSIKAPVVGSSFGPDQTRVHKVQKMIFTDDAKSLAIKTVVVTPDVPFGDCFHVVDVWMVEAMSGGGCKLTTSEGVRFDKNPWKLRPIKSTLLSRVHGDNKKATEQWVSYAQKFIQENKKEIDAAKKAMEAEAKASREEAAAEAAAPKAAPVASEAVSVGKSSGAESVKASTKPTTTASTATAPATTAGSTGANTTTTPAPVVKSSGLQLPGSLSNYNPLLVLGGPLVIILSLLILYRPPSMFNMFGFSVDVVLLGMFSLFFLKLNKMEAELATLHHQVNTLQQQLGQSNNNSTTATSASTAKNIASGSTLTKRK